MRLRSSELRYYSPTPRIWGRSSSAPDPLYLGISPYQFCPQNLCSESALIATLHTQPALQGRPQILVSEMYFRTSSHSSLSFLSPSRLYLSRSKEATIVLPYRNRPPSDNEGTWAWRRRRRNQSALQEEARLPAEKISLYRLRPHPREQWSGKAGPRPRSSSIGESVSFRRGSVGPWLLATATIIKARDG